MKKSMLFLVSLAFLSILPDTAYTRQSQISLQVSMDQPATHTFQVSITCREFKANSLDFKMPVWTPGYYQRLDFWKNVENFRASDGEGNAFSWKKTSDNTWTVDTRNASTVVLEYAVKTTRSFVATPYLDEHRGYIVPGGVFMYPAGKIQHPVTVEVRPYEKWKDIATGLDPVPGKPFTFFAADYDILYDAPLLVGNLEELPAFTVQGIPHRFIGYQLGDFDKQQFMDELKKIVEAAVDLIGDIPYTHYTFIGIGPGAGGIEHLNSTTVSFSGQSQNSPQSKLRTLFFLAHEYFHHYNVKRIRPVELGPFDYDQGSRTNLLWVSEGLSVYYEYLIVRRAGLCSEEELLNAFRNNILAFEGKPGRLHQTLVQASYETWSDGPFGRTGDEVNKTISYYDKGPAVGMLFDFRIRQVSGNQKSLDDVMRALYQTYYLRKKRGFTEAEFQKTCERVAGTSLDDVFQYVNTTSELDYAKYFAYAGMTIDTASQRLPGGWLGISTRTSKDSVLIAAVEFESPAWNAGLRRGNALLHLDGKAAKDLKLTPVLEQKKPGTEIELAVVQGTETKNIRLLLGSKSERSFKMGKKPDPDPVQAAIYQSWARGTSK